MKRIRNAMAVILLIASFIVLIPIPVSYTREAVEFQVNNPSYLENCTLTVKGTYRVNLFTDSEFRGKVILSGHPAEKIMKEYDTKLVFDKKYGASFEYNIQGEDELWCPVGMMAQNGFMRKPCITISLDENGEKVAGWSEGSSWASEDGFFVVTRTNDYENAIRILADYHFIDK